MVKLQTYNTPYYFTNSYNTKGIAILILIFTLVLQFNKINATEYIYVDESMVFDSAFHDSIMI